MVSSITLCIKIVIISFVVLLNTGVTFGSSPWVLIQAEEFDYEGLPDSTWWNYDTRGNATGWGNREAQWYPVASPKNTWVSDGTLKITAHKEPIEGKNYSSGRITTKNKVDWKYGRVEVRAKLPTGRGTWPAIWMLSTDGEYGWWPHSGEIDILEHVGYNPDTIFSTVHTGSYNHMKRTQVGKKIALPTATSQFHVYSMEWDEHEIRSYVDDIHYFTFSNEYTGSAAWPFNRQFYLILNLAIGGNLGGKQGIDDTLFPHVFEVDYVRLYQREEDVKIDSILQSMSLDQKIGQLNQLNARNASDELKNQVRSGRVGSLLNLDPAHIEEFQRIAMEESNTKIPLVFARDVIHGYRTILPIPLGMASSFNPELVKQGARISAVEATSDGIRWAFSPMIDVSRDSRWGRIAESFGEDPLLNATMGVAMIEGLQNHDLSHPQSMAACAKHFVGYGAAIGGRDYNSTEIGERTLRNIYFPPFEAAVKAGAASVMTAFNDNDGVPATGNSYLFKDVLRDEWAFNGVVVSDWNAVGEMIVHNFASNNKDAAAKAMQAGVDVDMMSYAYVNHLEELVKEDIISERDIDEAVKNLLRMKMRLGLFDNAPYSAPEESPILSQEHLDVARKMAVESVVLLKNENDILPLKESLSSIAIIGPMADAPHDQMGTWVFDGRKEDTQTPLNAFREVLGERVTINYVPGLEYSRDTNRSQFRRARRAVAKSDVALVFLGEESILSGEAHSLADIRLQGAQRELLDELARTKTPIVLVVMAGRALTLEHEINLSDAVLYAWHPGTMGGPALVDLIMGKTSPSARLPITFPRHVGQIPIYYNHNLTGRPVTGNPTLIEDIPREAAQSSLGNKSYYLDYGTQPLFPFGFGLSYTTFAYDNMVVITPEISRTDSLVVRIDISNTGNVTASEIAQLYISNKAGSIVRPVKELKAFRKAEIKPGETKTLEFILTPEDFAYTGLDFTREINSGNYEITIGPNSTEGLKSTFQITD